MNSITISDLVVDERLFRIRMNSRKTNEKLSKHKKKMIVLQDTEDLVQSLKLEASQTKYVFILKRGLKK